MIYFDTALPRTVTLGVVCYSSSNRDSADALRSMLSSRGIDSWMAPYDIPVGEKYAGVINGAVKNCGCLVL